MKSGDPDRRTLGADYRVDAIKDDHFDISADFTVSIQAIGADGMPEEKSYLSVQCVFYGHFHGRGKVKEEDVRRFADHEARLVFVPYLRQFVTDMTARMSIPPLMIPLAIGTRIAGEDRPALPSKRPARPRAKTVKRQP
jgi:preprotein translocase subunit SecB